MVAGLGTSLWLLIQVVELILYVWPVTLVVVLHIFVAFVISRSNKKFSGWVGLLTPFLVPFLALLIGGFFWHFGPRSDAPPIPLMAVESLFWIQILLCIGFIYLRKGRRWSTIALYLLAIWFGLICWFVTGMALTNVWL